MATQEELDRAIDEYIERFPEAELPIIGLSSHEVVRLIRVALDRSRPLTEEDLPPIPPGAKRSPVRLGEQRREPGIPEHREGPEQPREPDSRSHDSSDTTGMEER